MNYYNEFDPNAAAWLRGLIAENLIPPGEVDERSITEINAAELSGYTQCHFFAGIGGWPLALQLADWPADRPVWTGSCPCQPFSAAGKRKGIDDERHLWPAFAELIRQCRPPAVFGEQVASADGRQWLAGVFADLEAMGYSRAGADLCAAGVGAPHIRQRLYWVANANSASGPKHEHKPRRGSRRAAGAGDSAVCGGDHGRLDHGQCERCAARGLRDHGGDERQQPAADGEALRMADRQQSGLERHARHGNHGHESGRLGAGAAGSTAQGGAAGGVAHPDGDRCDQGRAGESATRHDGADGNSPWDDSVWLPCIDGKHRRIPAQSEIFPLADGLPYKLARRGSVRAPILKGAGNAIVPQTAAIFIRAAAL